MTQELFQKYINGRCNPQEKAEAERWMHTCSHDELDELFQALWDDQQNPAMSSAQTANLWEKIANKVADQYTDMKPRRIFSYQKWAIAALVLGCMIMSAIWIVPAHSPAHTITAQPAAQPAKKRLAEWATISNTDSNQKIIHLEDGSEVTLFAHSSIQYPVHFEAGKRSVFLTGKGIFHVAKDKQRPFTVYSADVATTALGTRFLVDANHADTYINVQLYEGKVVIRTTGKRENKKEVFLLPGDELTYTTNKKEMVVGKYDKGAAKRQATEGKFVNAELYTVFEKIASQYNVRIDYNKADIMGMYFTGDISQTGSVSKVLHVIAQMNGLQVREENGKYNIQKDKE